MNNREDDKIREMVQDSIGQEFTSSCCGASLSNDMDICTSCGEHCGAIDSEENEYEFYINTWIPKVEEKKETMQERATRARLKVDGDDYRDNEENR